MRLLWLPPDKAEGHSFLQMMRNPQGPIKARKPCFLHALGWSSPSHDNLAPELCVSPAFTDIVWAQHLLTPSTAAFPSTSGSTQQKLGVHKVRRRLWASSEEHSGE